MNWKKNRYKILPFEPLTGSDVFVRHLFNSKDLWPQRETWCFSDRASWIDYTLITNLMHWLLFIH